MRAVVEAINQTLRNIGSEPGRVLLDTIESFESMALTDEERISALASSIANSAVAYHGTRIDGYLTALRVSSMAIALELLPPPPSAGATPALGHIAEGADILSCGLHHLLDALYSASIGVEDRIVAEIALYARLLGRHDPNTVQMVLQGVDDAVNHPDFAEGDLVAVTITDPFRLDLTLPLDQLPTLGVA
ncbi:hypothetical protein GCM10011611_34900 [Aliidongia dinghuensis]|uniref:Uncharacterized protein n=1 Tax=Aliidongia dinghuensis TaxID=1867774 RepID=A0A8J2YUZ4_9PROT|nr:hypothetical protein [Aliidongia dinghuensis]GGF25872.1 hypothetical protein GCM10011611_34900 [Aliidongia dinghuensis]